MTTAVRVVATDARTSDANDVGNEQVDVDRWAALAEQALVHEGAGGELSLVFVDDDEIAELNEQYMGKIGPTDVLSFPIDGDEPETDDDVPRLLGDVVVAPGVASRQCAEHAGTIDDELALLVVHGVLHVLGHDHAEPDETARMRARELAILERHHWDGPPPAGFRQSHD